MGQERSLTRVTIADVAKEAGVSTMTVSRVINNKGSIRQDTRERVERAIAQLHYRPSAVARSLSTQRTNVLGLVVPDITNPFFSEIARGAEELAWAAGYMTVLCNTGESREREEEILRRLEDNRVDGIILCSSRLATETLLPLIGRHPAVVLINRDIGSERYRSLEVDDTYGTIRAVHHLLRRDHKTIALLAGPPDSAVSRKRLRGYSTALETNGYAVEADLILPCFPKEEGGYRAAQMLLNTRRDVTALLCYNDLVAIGALRACAEGGYRVPDDIAIVGCDDIHLASLVSPALTTLRVDKEAIGAQAVRLLRGSLEGRPAAETLLVKPELVVRASAP